MKTKLILSALLSFIFCLLSSQVPQGFNYQAIARDGSGNPIVGATIDVKLGIQADTSVSPVILWEEVHTGVKTNAFGLFVVVLGNGTKSGGSAATFANVSWSVTPLYLKTQIYYQSAWKYMGSSKLWSVPYALRSKDTETKQTLSLNTLDLSISGGNTVSLPAGSSAWQVSGSNIYRSTGYVGIGNSVPAASLDVTGTSIFRSEIAPSWIEVAKVSTGNRNAGIDFHGDDTYTDYALRMIRYSSGVNATSSITHKGLGELNFIAEQAAPIRFYNGGLHSMTIAANGNVGIGNSAPISKMVVQPPATWSDESPLFEVKNKLGNTVFAVYNNGVRIYVEDDAPYKGLKGGFAIGGFNPAKGGYTNDYMWVTPDSVRVYVDNTIAKGQKGGFAIGSFNPAKGTVPITLTHLTDLNYLIGHEAGKAITTGKYNTYFGYQAGRNTTGGTPSGFTYPGWANVFIGYQTGYSNTTGFKNVFLGYQAGQDNINGYYNTFIGNASGANNTTGVKNTFVGNESGEVNVSGSYNTFYGYNSGILTTSGYNTFIGADCGFNNSTGEGNAYVGSHAGEYFNGSYNTFLGAMAGRNYATLRTGNYNVFIGTYAGYNCGTVSNKLYIDPSTTSAPLIYGDFAAGYEVVRINGNLEYTGTIADVSDVRLKKNIVQIPDAINKIISLRGVSFDWNLDENPGFVLENRHQIGVIAQEVEKVLPELVIMNKEGYRMVDYTKLTPVLIEAVKEQQNQIEMAKQENLSLKNEVQSLKEEIEQIKAILAKTGLK